MINQLKLIDKLIATNRNERCLIQLAAVPGDQKTLVIRELDRIFHKAIRVRQTGHTLLIDLEESLSLETLLKYI